MKHAISAVDDEAALLASLFLLTPIFLRSSHTCSLSTSRCFSSEAPNVASVAVSLRQSAFFRPSGSAASAI